MDERQLKRLIRAKIDSSVGYLGGTLSDERGEMMDYYLGESPVQTAEGRSEVISTDVQDTIEKIMPTIMRIFESGGAAVQFEPENQEDVEVAEMASQYCDYIYRRDNEGFLNTYTWIKDGLLQKTGVMKVFWEEEEREKSEYLEGVSDDELTLIMQDENIEIEEHTEVVLQPEMQDGMGNIIPAVIAHNVKLERKETFGRVRIEPVPPEEFLIDDDARSLSDAKFVAHRVEKTISDLREDGVSEEILSQLPKDDDENEFSDEAQSRRQNDSSSWFADDELEDDAAREITIYECYLYADIEDKGKVSLRKVTVAGAADVIIDNEEVDIIPFCAWSPIIMPHRFTGRSVAELVMDIQKIKTTLLRQYLDNVYAANNQGIAVNEQVNISDLLVSRPNRIVRTEGDTPPSQHMSPLPYVNLGGELLNAMEYMDQIRKDRTSVGDEAAGLDPNVLANANSAVFAGAMEQARASIELIARVFAEVAMKDLFRKVLYYVANYQNKPRMVQLTNKWVQIDPSEWSDKMSMTVNVGLGTGNKDKRIANLNMILNAQKEALAAGITTPQHIYNALVDATEAMEEQSERYWQDPSQAQPQQPQPDPAQMLAQAEMDKTTARTEQDHEEMIHKSFLELQEMALKYEVPLESLPAYTLLMQSEMARHQPQGQ